MNANKSDDSENMIRIQIRLYCAEDTKLFTSLSALSPTERSRKIRQMLRVAALVDDGLYVLAVPQIAFSAAPTSKAKHLKTKSPKHRQKLAKKSNTEVPHSARDEKRSLKKLSSLS